MIRNRFLLVVLSFTALLAILPRHAAALEIKRSQLSNGAILLVSEQHQLPMISLAISFDAGARRDPHGKAGLAALTADALEQGTKDLSADEFNKKTDFMGSSVGVETDHDYASATMTSLKKYEDETLHMLAQILVNPGLRDADIARKKADQIAGINAEQEQPGYVAQVAFLKQLFGDGPYGHPINGVTETVTTLTPDDVRNFYRDHYKTGGAVIAVTGDVKEDEIKAKLEKELAGLSGTVSPQAEPPQPTVAAGIHLDVIDRTVAQANLILGSGGIARSNPDYYKLQVMNYILGGGGFASRLMKVVRSKGGLAYGVSSGFQAWKFPGAFLVVLQTKNKSANDAVKMILEQLHEIQDKPVSDDELNAAKRFLVGSFPLKIDRQSQITGFMLGIELNNLGLDFADRYPKLIDAVTAADVQEVARKYIHPEALNVIAVTNQAEAKVAAASFAPNVH
ncbi:MAG TPA: pitrilysin family protein [Candidatus Binataceae bacterium]|nr:pitrilysin family protein [Candidatus Binataceae bacterium]